MVLMRHGKTGAFACLCLAVLIAFAPAYGQVPTGSIAGSVLDPAGLAIAGADVVVINQGTHTEYKTTTSSLGAFRVSSLQAGLYRVRVSFSGFKTYELADIKLDAGTERSIPPIKLEVGAVSQTVAVEAAYESVQTTSNALSGTVEKNQIDALPILDRNPTNLVGLQAGVNQNGRSNTTINGTRSTHTSLTLDGINIQDNFIRTSAIFNPNQVILSQVAEFTITNSNAPSSDGFAASSISLVTPSGTNNYHGQVFWLHRNNAFAANDWFNNAAVPQVPNIKLVQNQGGGSLGGRIIKDKLFFYGYYELFRLRANTSRNIVTLTNTARQGLFTYKANNGTLQQINLLSIAGTKLSRSVGIDPFVANLLQQIPAPGQINNFDQGDSSASQLLNTGGYRYNQNDNSTRDNYGFKLDYTPALKHALSLTWSWNRSIADRGDLDITNKVPLVQNNDSIKFLSAAWRWTPTPRLTNEFRFGFNLAPASFIVNKNFGTSVIDRNPAAAAPYIAAGAGGFIFSNPLGDSSQGVFRSQGRDTKIYAAQYNGSYIRGNHTFGFGWQSQYIRTAPFTCFNCPASYFPGMSSANPAFLVIGDFPGGASSSVQTRANDLLASLAGFLTTGADEFNVTSQTSGFVSSAVNLRNYKLNNHALYINDSWRLKKNLTVNIGVRYEIGARLCEEGGLHLFPKLSDMTSSAAVAALLDPNAVFDFAGGCNGGTPFYNKDNKDWGPQVGLAWDPRGNGKTSIRTAYSIHYVNDEAIKAPVNAARGIPGLTSVANLQDLTGTISGGGLLAFPTPSLKVPRNALDNINDFGNRNQPQTTYIIDPNIRTPYVQQWSFGIQHEIGWKTVVEVSYRGNHGTRLTRTLDLNQVNIGIPGFLDDFNRARRNGFLSEARPAPNNVFDPSFNPSIPGSQPLTVITTLANGGSLTTPGVPAIIRRGEVGEYLSFSEMRSRCGPLRCVPNLLVSGADFLSNSSDSNYHAGVVEIRRRSSRGLYFQANYTYSKILTDSSGQDQNKFDPHLDNAQPKLDKSRANFDLTHAFKANFLYELPFGSGHRLASSRWMNRVVGGWNIGSIFTWQTGAPFSLLSNRGTLNRAGRSGGLNTAFTTLVNWRDLQSIVHLTVQPNGVYIIDPAQINAANSNTGVADDSIGGCVPFGPGRLCNPQPGQVGTTVLPKFAFSGPSYFNWNFNTFKKIQITERMSSQFRVDFTNVLNHPTFLAGDQNVNSTNFGRLSTTLSDPRRIQFGLYFMF